MPRLRLMQISCFDKNEPRHDEPMLYVDGKKVWSRKGVKEGQCFQLHNQITPIKFTESITIKLMEDDKWHDDHIGTHTVHKSEADDNTLRAVDFKGSGAYYYLIYHVLEN